PGLAPDGTTAGGVSACGRAEDALGRRSERPRVDRRETVELRLDLLEHAQRQVRLHETRREERPNVVEVLRVCPLDLRERLGVRIEMEEAEATVARHEETSVAPTRRQRDEVRRRDELDVHAQIVLQSRDGTARGVALGLEDDV